jgi:RNA polymerase sigma-70 factor (ECF subfamily)
MQLNNPVGKQLPDYLEALWRFAFRLTQSQDTAQELTQKTCLRALEFQATFNGGNLKSWLFKIMHNLWRDEVRHNVRAGLKLVGEATPVEQVANSDTPEKQLLLIEVQGMINQLPEAQRTVLLLNAVEGFTYQETADILKVPVGTVMSRLARAREKIGQSVLSSETNSVSLSARRLS